MPAAPTYTFRMSEQFAQVGEVELCYDQFGEPSGAPLLLIMGLGAPMTAWPNGFCELLAEHGFFVTRFDNRDIGRSTIMSKAGVPSTASVLAGRRSVAPYRLSDMAADAAGLLDEIGLGSAHVVGASMGGMISQVLAIEHPSKVRSLTSIMSTTGRKTAGMPSPNVFRGFVKPPPVGQGIEAEIEHFVGVFRTVGSRGDLWEEDAIRALAREALERGSTRSGTIRQLAAITSASDRTRLLRSLKVPALVIHGSADRLIHPSGGRATARAIPGSTYMEFSGMGHDLPTPLWRQMASAIAENARRAKDGGPQAQTVPLTVSANAE